MRKALLCFSLMIGTFLLIATPYLFAADPGTLKWKINLGDRSPRSPVIGDNGTIYVISSDSDSSSILAINPDSSIKWTYDSEEQIGAVSVAPNGNIYFKDGTGLHVLYDNGDPFWSYNNSQNIRLTGENFAIDSNNIAYSNSHTLDDYGYIQDYQLMAFDPNGNNLWNTKHWQIGPPVVNETGEVLYATTGFLPGSLVAFNTTDGSQIWEKGTGKYNSLPSIGADGNIYVSSQDTLFVYDKNGNILWQFSFNGGFASQPGQPVTTPEGNIFVPSFNYSTEESTIYEFDHEGNEIWSYVFRELLYGSPALGNDGVVYVGGVWRGITAIDPTLGLENLLLWEIGEIDGPLRISKSPIIGNDGTLYLLGYEYMSPGNEVHLYAINTSSSGPAISSWPMARANPQGTQMANTFINSTFIQFSENNHWYKAFDYLKEWGNAKLYCEALGGYLATLTSAEENYFVYNNLNKYNKSYWLGATDEINEGTWQWVTGEDWIYSNWAQGQPDNRYPGQNYLCSNFLYPREWDDNGLPRNNDEFYYICEWEDLDEYNNLIRETDLNGDQDIDSVDLSNFLQTYGYSYGDQNYNSKMDFNGDGIIDVIDLMIFAHMYGKLDTNINIDDCKYISKNTGLYGERFYSIDDKNCYDFSLNEPATIAILSTGNLDLKGELFQIKDYKVVPIDADNDGFPDEGDKRISNEFTDSDNVTHNNFMLRPGSGADGEIRVLPPGHYRFTVSFDDDAEFIDENYGIILLKRSQNQEELVDDFFDGMNAIINNDGGYEENDYLDIYVKALYPDYYENTNPTWHNSFESGGIPAERQCKALPNFYVYHILGRKDLSEPREEFLYTDCEIDNNFGSNEPDWVLVGPSVTIYNNLSSDPEHQPWGSEEEALKGDFWVKDMGCDCTERTTCALGTYNHYGLYFDDTSIIDANWGKDGRLQIAPTRDQDKVVRPE